MPNFYRVVLQFTPTPMQYLIVGNELQLNAWLDDVTQITLEHKIKAEIYPMGSTSMREPMLAEFVGLCDYVKVLCK